MSRCPSDRTLVSEDAVHELQVRISNVRVQLTTRSKSQESSFCCSDSVTTISKSQSRYSRTAYCSESSTARLEHDALVQALTLVFACIARGLKAQGKPGCLVFVHLEDAGFVKQRSTESIAWVLFAVAIWVQYFSARIVTAELCLLAQ